MSDRPPLPPRGIAPPVATRAVEVRVGGKINLFLGVRGLREDGYHELVTVLQTVSLHDRVVASMDDDPANLHPAYRRFLSIDFAHDDIDGVPGDESNLVVRAARLLMDALGGGSGAAHALPPLPEVETEVRLEKRIPVAGGMAGGSADAAATLVALNVLWDGGMTTGELEAMAAELGADVPFCVRGGTALATGTGTAVAEVMCGGAFHWVVGMSRQPLSTPEVYRTFDEMGSPTADGPDAVLAALRGGDPQRLAAALHNDLQEPAFVLRPDLRDAHEALLEAGALAALVSGSGPTVLGLVRDAEMGRQVADEVTGLFDAVEVVHSPAGGPSWTIHG
jgi:4-diphosphocytidyl-2-C-methyl-D-erythritol kinase